MQRQLAVFGHLFLTKPILSQSRISNPRNNGFKLFGAFMFSSTHNRRVFDPDDPSNLMKEDGVAVCSQMWIENFRDPEKTATNLVSYLRRFELWVLAYQKVCADEMGAYMPRSAVQRSALEDLLALRNAVLDNRFKWGARLEFFIKSPKDKTEYESLSKRKIRAILTTTQPSPFQDRIVQEVLFMILEPIYEARFSQKSFAFRPGRTAHTVLRVVRRSFAGYLWYIKGDVSTVLDGMKVGMVISALMRDVRDKTVIDLVKSALVTPVITSRVDEGEKKKKVKRKYQKKRVLAEDEPKPDPYWLESFFGFAPEEAEKVPSWGHCGILSRLLANVCLDELDRWMEGKITDFYRPSKSDVIWNSPDGEVEQGNTSWPEFVPTSGPDKTRKIDYVRFGGHILIGVRGPRADAATLRKQLIEFCDQKYMLKLDNESLPIEHITKGIMFLDHVLCRRVVYPTLRYTATGGKIISEKGVGTLLSVTASLKQCIKQFRKLNYLKGDRDPDPQPCFKMFHATQAHTNQQMNKFLSTMVEWYRYADNRKKIVNFCSYIIRGSLAKLYAAKYKLRSRAKVYKIGARNLSRPIKEKKGQSPEYHNLLRMGLAESIDGLQYTRMSLVPETDYTPFPTGWRPDHEKALLEYIRLDDPRTLDEQRQGLSEQGLISPQDYTSMLVWNYKRSAIPQLDRYSTIERGEKLLGCNDENDGLTTGDEEDGEERGDAAQMTFNNGSSPYEIDMEDISKLLPEITKLLVHNSINDDIRESSQNGDMMTLLPTEDRWQIMRASLWGHMSAFLKQRLKSSPLTVEDNSPPCDPFPFLSDSTKSEIDSTNMKTQIGLLSAVLSKLLIITFAHISSYCERQLGSSLLQQMGNGFCGPILKWLKEFGQFDRKADQKQSNQGIDSINMRNNEIELILWNMCADPKVICGGFG